jgi:hypothetical protein
MGLGIAMKKDNRVRWQRRLVAASVALITVPLHAQVTATWLNPVSGSWTDPTKWSTDPVYPNNGIAGANYDVRIGSPGAPYTVSSSTDISVHSLTLDSSNVTLKLGAGELVVSDGLTIAGGTLSLSRVFPQFDTRPRLLLDGPQTVSGHGAIAFTGPSTLDFSSSLTIGSGITVTNINASGTVGGSTGGFLINNGTISAQGSAGSGSPYRIGVRSGSWLNQGALQAIDSGSLTLTGTGTNSALIYAATGGQIGIGGNWFNSGTIDTSSGSLTSLSGNWTNTGTIVVGKKLVFDASGTWSNTGFLSLLSESDLSIAGSITPAQFTAAAAAVQRDAYENTLLSGTLNNAGNNFIVDPNTFGLDGGTIRGGTISTTGGSEIRQGWWLEGGGQFVDVVIDADYRIESTLNFQNVTIAAGRTLRMRDVPTKIVASGLLSGNGTISLENGTSAGIETDPSGSLTIGPGIRIVTTQSSGFIDGGTSDLHKMVNQGTIASVGSSAFLGMGGTWRNEGVIEATGGSAVDFGGQWSNFGTISIANSQLLLDSLPSQFGTLNLSNASIGLTGTFTTASIAPLKQFGVPISVAAYGDRRGTIDNSAATFAFSAAESPIRLEGGQITGGTLTTSDNTPLLAKGGNLTSVFIDVPLTLSGTDLFSLVSCEIGRPLDLSGGRVLMSEMTVSQPLQISSSDVTVRGSTLAAPVHVNAGSFSLEADSTNSNFIIVNAGVLTLASPASNLAGSISLNDSRLRVPFMNAIPNLSMTNSIVCYSGTLDNAGKTTDFGNTPLGPMHLSGAHINGGTIVSSAALFQVVDYAVFSDVVIGSDLDVPKGASLTLWSDGTLSGDATIKLRGFVGGNRFGIAGLGTINVDAGTLQLRSTGPGITVVGADASWYATNYLGNSTPPMVNNGTLIAASGISTIGIEGWNATLQNNGTFIARDGARLLSYSKLANLVNGTLTGGHYYLYDGSIGIGGQIRTNAADVRLDGPNSQFSSINFLQANLGTFTVTNGRDFVTKDKLTNSGTFVVGPKSTVVVKNSPVNSGTIDLAGGAMLIDYPAGPSPLLATVLQILSGRNGGSWDRPGILSSSAAVNPLLGIGYAEATDLFTGFPASFQSQTIDDTTVLTRLTLLGDADLNGIVDAGDLGRLSTHWQMNSVWTGGDFDYDGYVDIRDLRLLAANWGATAETLIDLLEQTGLPSVTVPEPAATGLVVVGIHFLQRRRRKACRADLSQHG